MKLSIRDPDILRSVKPLDLAAYLRVHDWRETEREEGRYAFWYKNGGDEEIEVLLPLNHEVRDYATRIAEVLHALEVAESRSQLEILTDIQSGSHDVIRIAAEHEQLVNGTIPLERGVQFVTNAQALLLAAACSTAQPREAYPARKPTQALDYMHQVRMGQSEHGSYVVTLHSPIPPLLRVPKQLQFFGEAEEPFARKASQMLMQALHAVQVAAERSVSTGEFAPFQEMTSQGISANLCDALVGLYEGSNSGKVRVRMSWSPVRTIQLQVPKTVVIASDIIPIIKEAARFLRVSASREEFLVRGFVVGLKRPKKSISGQVTISGFVDDQYRNIQVDLSGDDYEAAVHAHQELLPVRCEGELVREGRLHVLRSPRNFIVEQHTISP